MDVRLIPKKLQQRLNKLSSSDYDNLECWQIIEAYNKAEREWARRQIHGGNQFREGAETSRVRVDDLQVLLKPVSLKGINRDYYFETQTIPTDYMAFSRAFVRADKDNCKDQRISCRLREDANTDLYLDDESFNPSFLWRSTFVTLVGDKIRVYTNNDFTVKSLELVYYRQPKGINLSGCQDITGVPGTNVNPEFKDDIVEIVIDEAASILAGDIESLNQAQITKQRAESNN